VVEPGLARQGEIYWVDFGFPVGSEAGFLRPSVVIQHNRFNESGIRTVVVCPLTSRIDRSRFPGHVVVPSSETGLPRDSVSMPALVTTVDLARLAARVKQLGPGRLRQVIAGVHLVTQPPSPGA
jgi:mRNA interferase MazF